MSELFARLSQAGFFSPLDRLFAESMFRLGGGPADGSVLLATALVSRQVERGHVCLDLARPPAPVAPGSEVLEGVVWPEPGVWTAAVAKSPLVTDPLGSETPLVLDEAGRLYLRRYWEHQRKLAEALLTRASSGREPADETWLRAALFQLFPGNGDLDQRVAALSAVTQRLTVITGGPGTGKTSTVVKILALLTGEAERRQQALPRVRLLAPTGKAAGRLTEAMRATLDTLEFGDDIRSGGASVRKVVSRAALEAAIPEASTIHRALGPLGAGSFRFRHDAGNPLLADFVIVDEASMVDLPLMSRLVAAVPAGASMVWLGDRDQLASVEAGAVLGDFCDREVLDRPVSCARDDRDRRLAGASPASSPVGEPGLRDSIVALTHSYRYDDKSGIGRLATAIREGDAAGALAVLDGASFPDVERHPPPAGGGLDEAFREEVLTGFREACATESEPLARLDALDGFRVLAAHRKGRTGVEELNRQVEGWLRAEGRLGPDGRVFEGRPILVTRNDYSLALYNGDVGLVVRNPDRPEHLVVAFRGRTGGLRLLSPGRLPAHETGWAMTVHRSQGSEVSRVLVVLPEVESVIVTRELLYTAVTRARERVIVQASERVIRDAIGRRTERASGLRDLLWR